MFLSLLKEGIRINKDVFDASKPLLTADWRKTNVSLLVDDFTRAMRPKLSLRYFDKKAVDSLRSVYFTDTTNIHAIQNENIAFHSDLHIRFNTLKAAILQTEANNKNAVNKDDEKNTFFFRFVNNVYLHVEFSQSSRFKGQKMTKILYFISKDLR